jgi:addiction module RelB/DinJ family antitoxin
MLIEKPDGDTIIVDFEELVSVILSPCRFLSPFSSSILYASSKSRIFILIEVISCGKGAEVTSTEGILCPRIKTSRMPENVLQITIQRCTISLKGGDSMKDATVSARVEYDIKAEAEDILQRLGIPVSVLINSLYRQIIYRNGIPFSLSIPQEPVTLDTMTTDELDAKLQHSYEQSLKGEGRPFNDVFDDLERNLL